MADEVEFTWKIDFGIELRIEASGVVFAGESYGTGYSVPAEVQNLNWQAYIGDAEIDYTILSKADEERIKTRAATALCESVGVQAL